MDEFIIDDQTKLWKYISIINEKIKISDVLRDWGLRLHKTSGQFEWKVNCPLPNHKGKGENGQERTPSFCVTQDNRYFCFGCNGYGSVVDLISLVQGIPQIEVIRKLAIKIGLIDEDGKWNDEMLISLPEKTFTPIDPEKVVDPYVLKVNVSLYNYIKKFVNTAEFEKELKWVEKIGKTFDEHLNYIGHEDWEYAKDLHDKILFSIKNRKKRKI